MASREAAEDAALPRLSTPEAFAFPYERPYDIQLDLMRTVFRAIEDRKIAIIESPTGTGKSLTLLTATLTWLQQNQKRLETADEERLRANLIEDDPDDPPWVIEHAMKNLLADRRAAQSAQQERLVVAREKERRMRQANAVGAFRNGETKRARRNEDHRESVDGPKGDEEFLPEDPAGAEQPGESSLSAATRELMAKYEASRPKARQDDEDEDDVQKIYYTSRTHTQLRQLTSELLKTTFAVSPDKEHQGEEDVGVSLVPLGSRKQLCINEKVRALGRKSGDERMNESCLDMQKAGSSSRCEFLPTKEQDTVMLDARDSILVLLASVKDIEDIVTSGKKACVCPYYASRRAVKQAQLVTLPYNLLLQKNAREALDIDLTDQIIVIDEAHNLIDTLLSIYSTSLTTTHLKNATNQLQHYLKRVSSRLKPIHSLWIRQTLNILQGLNDVCNKTLERPESDSKKAEMLTTTELISRAGKGNDQVNLMELVRYLRESKLARKVSGFIEKLADDATRQQGSKQTPSTAAKHAAITAFHQVESFLLSLTDARDDGRVLISIESSTIAQSIVSLKYILLNPAERFREVVDQARCVILAGGTIEPISDFMTQLFPSIPRDRFSTLSCAHVIPKSNLLTQVVCRGPRKTEFEFKYTSRGDPAVMSDLGTLIHTTVGLVPDGVVVFLPSYAFLNQVKTAWDTSGLLARLGEKKQIFYEPQISGDVESILRDYSLAISSYSNGLPEGSKKNGALLFAVVGGKLSEGINFSDALGRCVIMVGLPFANVGSVELQERMRYVETLPGAGKDAAKELYENLCMRAVNQSIGRAIRHANDYATILLVDKRYAQNRIRTKLPRWIGEDVKVQEDFGGAARSIAAFFKEKRERGVK